ncbi:Uncharacterized protein dnm_000330 [Desulfonema magnum]|uniref:Uncharacterized protein n=1 Tax=Desulfonema magnum TaxID=45655 RepID=A0A975GJV9_9BACT|nr:Uncharacterized protein dnm_000330 [Desulfonema magnum]
MTPLLLMVKISLFLIPMLLDYRSHAPAWEHKCLLINFRA